ncbi:MAG TPA: undecaprenyl-diphosphate phosphatase [Thermohalobaculum sp.]|nr:undecaprenyl-diphosphate phosphatase [Thermohalobaculum sp.]
MTLFDVVVLSLIQGITEFLPISSSGHLVLWPLLTGRPDQGLMMDVAVHFGTFVAICWFFRGEIASIARGLGDIARRRLATPDARLVWLLGVATVPAVVVGLALSVTGAVEALRALEIIGWTTLLGGILLWLADRFGPERRESGGWTLRDAILMGLAQALALVPGTSRSGITMTAARALGFERTAAARIALLMAVPVTLAASTLEVLDLASEPTTGPVWHLVLGAVLSCLAALGALSVMFRMFSGNWTMGVFALYRLVLGAVLLGLAYG